MQHFGKGALRIAKNYTKGYSDTQAKVRDATSNDPWGPSGTQMNEIAQLTYNQNDFVEIMEMLDKRLNDKGKNWRHVFKSLTVLDYCLHQGSENVVIYFRDNLYIIKTLKEFQYVDEDGKDQGANVRQKAKDITALLQDENRLREARRQRALMRDRMIRGTDAVNDSDNGFEDENRPRRNGPSSTRPNREEDELRRAIEESKRSHEAEELRAAEERDLERAIKLSEEEEKQRKLAVDNSNASSLFDDQNQLNTPVSTTSSTLLHFTDPTPYTVGLQPQYTQQPLFTGVQQHVTSFNPYQLQAEQEAAQAEYLRQQQAFAVQQQQAQAQLQQAQLQQQQAEQAQLQQQQAQIHQQQAQQAQQAQQEEWFRQQQLRQFQQEQLQQQQTQNLFLQAQQLSMQPTGFGSNNPFAQPSSPSSYSPSPQPTQKQPPQFNLQGTYDTHSTANLPSLSASSTPSQINQNPRPAVNIQTRKDTNEHERRLADLFANRDDGQDTFGNVGLLRYGQTDAGRAVLAHRTGTSSHNPFAQQQPNSEQPFFDI